MKEYTDDEVDAIKEYRAGHAERMEVAQAKVDENLRQHAEHVARDQRRSELVARIRGLGGNVRDENCCFSDRVELPPAKHAGGSINLDLSEMTYGDGKDPELLVLETIALLLEAYCV